MKRRRSVIGPLILIGLGVIFLLRNMYPEMRVLEFMSRVWPWVLIAWGVLRIGELIFWNSEGRPLPQKGISGGEWAFIILFSIFGSALNHTFRADNWFGFPVNISGMDFGQEPFEFPIEAKINCSKTPRFVIESFRGDAQIVGGDVEEIRVTGRKVIRDYDHAKAENLDKQSKVELVQQGEQVVLRLNQQRNEDGNNRQSARLEIVVPRGASIEGHGRYGDFDLRDINGTVRIDSDNAGVRLENINGSVIVETRRSDLIRAIGLKSSIELRGRGQEVELERVAGDVVISGSYTGTVQFRDLARPIRYKGRDFQFEAEKVTGEVRTSVGNFFGENLIGPIRISSNRSYDVQLADFSDMADIKLSRGNINLRPKRLPFGRMQVETGNGDIDLFIPEKARFELKAVARRGEVNNDWGDVFKAQERQEGREHILEGAVGGGSKISLESGRGTINVWKRSGDGEVSPMPPPQPGGAPVAPKPPIVVPPARVE